MENKITEKEIKVLNIFYNRFYNLFDEIVNDDFSNENSNIRFIKLREAFSVYKELLNFEPIKNI